MVRLRGGHLDLAGTRYRISEDDLIARLEGASALLYMQSHHVTASAQVPLGRCVSLAHQLAVPVILDAAAEEDLQVYVHLGVDLVVYSGGKALGGLSSSGFVAGRSDLVRAVRAQERGIGRAMKVGPEQLLGALKAGVASISGAAFGIVLDEAGRPIERLEVRTPRAVAVCRALRAEPTPIFVRATMPTKDDSPSIPATWHSPTCRSSSLRSNGRSAGNPHPDYRRQRCVANAGGQGISQSPKRVICPASPLKAPESKRCRPPARSSSSATRATRNEPIPPTRLSPGIDRCYFVRVAGQPPQDLCWDARARQRRVSGAGVNTRAAFVFTCRVGRITSPISIIENDSFDFPPESDQTARSPPSGLAR